jgi:low temperature requirement protein LtrA
VTRSWASTTKHNTTFVELFFDLVFVFCFTQIVGLLHHDLSWTGVGHSVLVFWLVWWGWTQFTWALNAADATHPHVELATLVATALAFFMAVSIPGSFSGRALGFAVTYVLVRSVGMWIYEQAARSNPGQHASVRLFTIASTGGLAAVLVGGIVGGAAQAWIWALAVVLDLGAAGIAARGTQWGIHAEHFADRHGLIIIIALGESLIVAAAGLAEAAFAGPLVAVALLGVLVSCALWWTYFPIVKPELERALHGTPAATAGAMARDTFSLSHFPMLCGIVAYAVALEDAIAHPADPLLPAARLALAAGLLLFLGGTAFAMWRATCGRPVLRVAIAVVTAAAVWLLGSLPAAGALAVALAGAAAVALTDEIHADRLRG